MKNRGLAAAFAAMAAFAAFANEAKTDSFKVHFVERATGPVVLDGKFDEADWKTAEPILDWGPTTFLRRKPAVMPETWIKYLWDDKYLYIAMRCGEEDFPEENMKIFRKNDYNKAQPVYARDCVEMHLDGNNDLHTKFQIWFAPTEEHQIFWYYDFGWGLLEDHDYGLNADWDYKVSVDDRGWQFEARLALAHFEMTGREGNICAAEPCRFRLMKHMKGVDGTDLGVTTRLWGWATQGGEHADTPRYGKLIFVGKRPKDLVDGLRCAYPDLDERKILVQTTTEYIVVEKGRVTRQAYVDKARAALAETQRLLDRTDALVKEPAPTGTYTWTTNGIAKQRAEFLALKERLGKAGGCDIGLLTEILDGTAKWNPMIDDGYWNTLKGLLRREEGKARHPVRLEPYDPKLPTLADEEKAWPDPATRRYPRVEWAKTLAEKSPKTLIVTDRYGEIDAYLLKDRLGLDADIYAQVSEPPSDGEDYWHEGLYTSRFRQRILENMLAKTKYDAMVFLGVTPQYWTSRLQCWMLERMYEGLDVVLVNNGWNHWEFNRLLKRDDELVRGGLRDFQDLRIFGEDFANRRLYESEPIAKRLPGVETGMVGKGRLTAYNPGKGQTYMVQANLSPCWWAYPDRAFDDEYCMAATVRAVMAGLGLRPPRRALEVTVGADGTAPAGKAFDAALTTTGPEPWKGTVRYLVRDTWGKVVQDGRNLSVALDAGEQHVSLAVKALPAGRYTVDAWLLGPNGGVMDFAFAAAQVADREGSLCNCNPSCRRVLPPAKFADVALAKSCFEANEKIVATVKIENAVKGMQVEATVRDVRKRAVIRERFDVAVSNGVARLALDPARLDHSCNFLETRLFLGRKTLAEGPVRPFYRHDPHHADYEIFADPAPFGGLVGDARDAFMQHFGVSLFQTYTPGTTFRGGNPVYRHWISGNQSDKGGSMSSPHYAKDLTTMYAREARALRSVNGHFLSLGDDSGDPRSFTPGSPDWLPPFLNLWEERFLRERERDPKLNIQTQMRDWFVKRGMPQRGGGNWHWGFEVPMQRGGFRDLLKARLSKADVADLVGCFQQAYQTVERFNRHNGMDVKGYNEITTNTIARLNPVAMPEFLNFQFWLRDRYGKDIAKLNAVWKSDWKDFFDVQDAFIDDQKFKRNFAPAVDRATFFEDNFIGQFRAIAGAVRSVDPSMGVGLCASTLGNAMPEVLEHLNTMGPYLGGEEIEVARCLPHVYLGETIGVYGGRLVPCPMREYQVYHGLFTGANFSWFWATCYALQGNLSALPERSRRQLETYREVTRGPAALTNRAKRQNDGIRILISRTAGRLEPLVAGQCTHAQARTSFARVIEDLGLQFDYITTHQVERGELASSHAKVLVLGCVQTFTPGELAQIRAFVRAGGKVLADVTPGIADNWGRLLEKPALEKDQYELLGFKPAIYTFLRGRGELGTMRTDTLKRFADWGIRPQFRTVNAKGEEVTNVEYSRFVRGAATYLGYEKIANSFETFPMKAFLKLEKPQWVYEVRSGRAYGFTDTVELELKGLDCLLFACLPAEAKPVTVEAPKAVRRGGTLHVKAQSSAQVLRFEMMPPDGYSEERFEPMVFRLPDTKDGAAECDFAIAWDEPYDGYTLIVTDVATGRSVSQKIKVTD